MHADQIREMVLDRMEVLAPFVSEYMRLAEAERMLGTIPEVKQARPHRRRGRPPRALQEARQAQHEAQPRQAQREAPPVAPAVQPPQALQEARQAREVSEARLHVQTIRMPRSEFEDRELVYTTEEPAA